MRPNKNNRNIKISRLFTGVFALAAFALLIPALSASAAPLLTITPISWGVIGLDSNKVTDGPNTYQIGARVCNTGDAPANNVVSSFIYTPTNAYITVLTGTNTTLTMPTLAAGGCTLFNYSVAVARNSGAYNKTLPYQISATATGVGSVSTPPLSRDVRGAYSIPEPQRYSER